MSQKWSQQSTLPNEQERTHKKQTKQNKKRLCFGLVVQKWWHQQAQKKVFCWTHWDREREKKKEAEKLRSFWNKQTKKSSNFTRKKKSLSLNFCLLYLQKKETASFFWKDFWDKKVVKKVVDLKSSSLWGMSQQAMGKSKTKKSQLRFSFGPPSQNKASFCFVLFAFYVSSLARLEECFVEIFSDSNELLLSFFRCFSFSRRWLVCAHLHGVFSFLLSYQVY